MISDGTNTITPDMWITSDQAYESQNRTHKLLSGRVAVTLGAVAPRSGKLGLLFTSEEAAAACVDLHRNGTVFQIEEPTRPTLNMYYVLNEGGAITFEVVPEHDFYLVGIEYQEVIQ